MKTTTPSLALAAALASLFTLTSGAPAGTSSIATTQDDPGLSFTPRPKTTTNQPAIQANDCGDSTFENQSSGASPSVADCWHLHDNIVGDGTWTVWAGQHTIATYGSCAFGVTVQFGELAAVHIGNEDIRDLVRDSINKYGGAGVVGARGQMQCWAIEGGRTVPVVWGIYHT